jgi:hypothetical protein
MAGEVGDIVVTDVQEKIGPTVYYHQTTPEIADQIKNEGFRKGAVGGADVGFQGFIRGTFIKETPDLLDSPKLGKTQLEVDLKNGTKILDLTGEYPGSFVQEKSAWSFPGRQAFALAGWLERNGYVELADQYHEGIRRVYSGQSSDRLNDMWPIVENKLKSLGYSGIKFTDIYKDSNAQEQHFPATVIFDPDNIIVK